MIWTPSILPPHPSTIPTLSPLAQSVIELIRQEGGVAVGNSSNESSYRVAIPRSTTFDRYQSCINDNVQQRSNEELFPEGTDGLFEFQSPDDMNLIKNDTRNQSRTDGNSINSSNTLGSTPYFHSSFKKQTVFEISPWTKTNSCQTKPFSRSICSQVQPPRSLGHTEKGPHVQAFQSNPFEPLVEIMERNTGLDQPYDSLSPDMNCVDMEVCSRPFNEKVEENGAITNYNKKTSLDMMFKVPVISTANNCLNFKEIKRRPLQNLGLQIRAPLKSAMCQSNKTLATNKMEPSDQTFVFSNVNNIQNFKKKLTEFKNTNRATSDSKALSILKEKEDKGIFLYESGNDANRKATSNVNETSDKNKLISRFFVEKESSEPNDIYDKVFENALSKFEPVNQNNNFKVGNKIHKGVGCVDKTISIDDSISTCVSRDSERLQLLEIQRNALPVEDLVTSGNSREKFSFFTGCSDLSENLFVKTQESSINSDNYRVKSRLDEVDELNQFEDRSNVVNFAACELTFNQQSEVSQNLFVNTQESACAYKNDHPLNKIKELNDQNQSDEFSFPPYQIPFESNSSPNFVDVDNLFSVTDDPLKECSATLESDNNFNNIKTLIANVNGEVKRVPISCVENENIVPSVGNTKKSEERKNHFIKQKTYENTKSIKNCSFQPVKSKYFRVPGQLENSDFKGMSMTLNEGNKENCHKLEETVKTTKANNKSSKMTTDIEDVAKDRTNLMEVGIETKGGNTTDMTLNKKPLLKQSTLFDCGKFLTATTPTEELNSSETKDNKKSVEVLLDIDKFKKPLLPDIDKFKKPLLPDIDKFKKPLLPVKKTKSTKISPKVNTGKFDKSPSLTKLDKQMCPKTDTVNKFLQSNTPLQEIKLQCDPSKMVQSSLIKNESVKRNISLVSKPKKSKKPCFVPPITASHSTSQEVPLNTYTITVIDDVSADEVLQRLASDELTKVVTTVTFKEGYTLLNKPEDQKKNSRCFPSGVMFMLVWGMGKCGYYWLPLVDKDTITPSMEKLVDTLMSQSERHICFEAQAVYMLLMDVFKFKNISNWNAYDPLIGCWLLDPDNPPKDFRETSAMLEMDKTLLLVNPQANTKNQACDLLPVLDAAMNVLQNRLVNAFLWMVFTDMETKLIPILAVMESSSILVDVEKLHKTADAMDKKLRKLQTEAHRLADRWFQLNSPQQLREILYDKLKLDEKFNLKIKKTEHGVKSTSETVLEQMKEYHPLPGIILEYRRLQKLKSTYVDGLIQHVKSDKTIGTSWEQVSAATGRITSKNPNLQAFPKCPINVQDGETIYIREMFKAREGCTFLAADFQQIEFRVFAHFTQDKSLLQAFGEGGDIFQRLAERWLGGKGDEEREKTKRIVYSVMYGAGANKLSEYLHVEPSDAYKIIDNFVAIFPSLRSLPRTVIAQCRAQGFVATLSGRRRLFPHIRSTNGKLRSYSERQAMNFLIQGSAADICKAAMLDCETEIRSRRLRAKLLLMIHDELIWEVDDQDLQETSMTVRKAMEQRWNDRLTLLVPIPVCVSTGKTLANMLPLEP